METLTLKQLSSILTEEPTTALPKRNDLLRKIGAGSLFLAMDLCLLALSILVSLFLRDALFPGEVVLSNYVSVIPLFMLLFPAVYYLRGLYPGFGVDAIRELRTLTFSTSLVYGALAILTFFIKDDWFYSRLAFLSSWLLSLGLIPLGRAVIRKIFGSRHWWGIPVIVIGAGKAGEKVIKSMQKHSHIGLRPIVAVDDDIDRWGYINGIPVIGGLEVTPDLASKLSVDHAMIAMPSVPSKRQKEIIWKFSRYFLHTTVIPDIFGLSSLWVSTRDIGGILGLEVQQRLIRKSSLATKRVFDILLTTFIGIFALPLILLISLLIFIDSRGRIFFRQERMGIADSRFEMIKFRTMHVDAEQRLQDLLDQNPEMRAEYEIYHKLRNDPRMTRVGKFLRKFSLDELPQFWNVIKGDMSLIGPRAYMPWEKYKMNGQDEVILKVKPGISGLWQVTDRNASSFEERNSTDVYYIRNWSMFFDIYIVARTIGVVLTGNSGY